MTSKKLGIVIPVRNEAENIIGLIYEINDALAQNWDFEIVIVDDNSSDGTGEKIESVFHETGNIIILTLARKFGQTIALRSGIEYIKQRVDVIITMDGDGQDNPYEIEKLINPIIQENFDLVIGSRVNRADSWGKRNFSKIANSLIKYIFKLPLNDQGSPLKAFKPHLYERLPEMKDQHRYIPLLAGLVGAQIKEVPVMHRPRKYGKSKYGLTKSIKVMLDLPYIYITCKSQRSIPRFTSALSIFLLLTALIIQIELVLNKIIYGKSILEKVSFYFSLNLLIVAFLLAIMTLVLPYSNKHIDVMYKENTN